MLRRNSVALLALCEESGCRRCCCCREGKESSDIISALAYSTVRHPAIPVAVVLMSGSEWRTGHGAAPVTGCLLQSSVDCSAVGVWSKSPHRKGGTAPQRAADRAVITIDPTSCAASTIDILCAGFLWAPSRAGLAVGQPSKRSRACTPPPLRDALSLGSTCNTLLPCVVALHKLCDQVIIVPMLMLSSTQSSDESH